MKLMKKIHPIALWIKTYQHPVKMIAGFVFVLALLAAFFWMTGCELESLVVFLGMFSSLLFALPSVANFIAPDRKPIREMGFDELREFLLESDPKKDWKLINTDWFKEAFANEDPRLRIRIKLNEQGLHNDNFEEPWIRVFADKSASSYWADFTYGGDLIQRFLLILVDGGLCWMPLPYGDERQPNKDALTIAEIFDEYKHLTDYLKMAKFGEPRGLEHDRNGE